MIYSFLISALTILILHYTEKPILSPDGNRYYSNEKLYGIFNVRWLLPYICGQSEFYWKLLRYGSIFLIPPAVYTFVILNGMNEYQALLGSALACTTPFILFNFVGKYLIDGFGMLLSLCSAILFLRGNYILGIITSLIGSMANEKVFIYSALFAWNPLALIGGVSVLIRYLFWKSAETDILDKDLPDNPNQYVLDHPFQTGWKWHKKKLYNIQDMILPLGALIPLAFMGNITPQLVATLLVAYGSMFVATDTVRLYSWCFPVLILSAVTVYIPLEIWWVVVGLNFINLYKRNCI